jgi:hypothetical protein
MAVRRASACLLTAARGAEPTVVEFLPLGDYYVVGSDRQLMAYTVESNELLFTTSMPFRINAVVPVSVSLVFVKPQPQPGDADKSLQDSHVAVCGYGDTVYIINVPQRMCTSYFKAHEGR